RRTVAENEDQVNELEETLADATSPEEPAVEALKEQPEAETPVEPTADEVVVEGDEITMHEDVEDEEDEETPRVKPAIPRLDRDVDIVREGEDVRGRGERPRYSEDEADEEGEPGDESEEELPSTIVDASIDLAAGARYRVTGKRKTAVARVTLKLGTGEYVIN